MAASSSAAASKAPKRTLGLVKLPTLLARPYWPVAAETGDVVGTGCPWAGSTTVVTAASPLEVVVASLSGVVVAWLTGVVVAWSPWP